jgi:CHASE3 domain sensor protein
MKKNRVFIVILGVVILFLAILLIFGFQESIKMKQAEQQTQSYEQSVQNNFHDLLEQVQAKESSKQQK